MNKYTQTFNSDQLESNYQASRIQLRKYLLVGISITVIINNFLKLIINVSQGYYDGWYMQFTMLMACLLALMFVNKMKNSCQFYLIILNYVSLIEYFTLNNTYNLHQAYAKGYNIMSLQLIILLASDFYHSVHLITLNTIIRIFCSFVFNNKWQVQQYQLAFSFIVLQIGASYCLNLALRSQFLLKIKEQQIQQFIPIVIEKPFYYFEYKNDMFSLLNSKIQLNPKFENLDYCDGCRFRQMLRSYRFQNQCLESFIIKRIHMNTTQYSQQNLEIQTNSKNKQTIQYSELFSDKTQFLIVFNQNVSDLQSFNEIQNYYNKFQSFILNHIKQTYKILKLPKYEIQRNIIRLNLSCTSDLLIKNKTIKSFDVQKILHLLRKIVHKNVKIITFQQKAIINTYKGLFIQAFYQIFEMFNQIEKDERKQISLAFMTNETKCKTYLKIIISVNQSEKFNKMWKSNYVLQQIQSILFVEVHQSDIIRLLILDLEDAIPFSTSLKRKKVQSISLSD